MNTTGVEPATSVVVGADGTFTLGGGADVVNSGRIDTAGTQANQNGGQIVLLGQNVTSSGTLNAGAASGNGGEIGLEHLRPALAEAHQPFSEREIIDALDGEEPAACALPLLSDMLDASRD